MKEYRVVIKPTAENDIERRYSQIAEEAPENALSWYLDIISALETLDTLAERCPIAPEDIDFKTGIRHLIIGNYRVLYAIRDDIVEVLHVRHVRHDRTL